MDNLSSATITPLPSPAAVEAKPPPPPPAPHPFNSQILMGVVGVFTAAMMSGLNSRISGLTLVDIKGVFGAGADDGSWIGSVYSAFELAAMPFAAWFAVTFSFRRFHIGVVAIFTLLGLITPYAPSFDALIVLRALQGFFGGLLIPLLMAAALRFFPLPIRLYGLALYAMTATFSPNVATWLAATYTDTLDSWHLIYWAILPLALFSIWAVFWGVPQDPVRLERFKSLNLLGLVSGVSGLVMLGLGLAQGERYDWFNDTLVCWLFISGGFLTFIFLLTEWFHPLPFIKLQLLHRRNLGLGFTIFFGLLIVLLSGSLLPADYLSETYHFRTPYLAILGLTIGLPQVILGPTVSFLLYKQWMDARYMFAGGLVLIATSCFIAMHVTSAWMAHQFLIVQALQAFGQPMAVISMLFLATSVVQPMEGPVISGIVNVLRAGATLAGDALVERILTVREKIHANVLLDSAAHSAAMLPPAARPTSSSGPALASLAERISEQAYVLATSDGYIVLGLIALVLIPFVLNLTYIKPPVLNK